MCAIKPGSNRIRCEVFISVICPENDKVSAVSRSYDVDIRIIVNVTRGDKDDAGKTSNHGVLCEILVSVVFEPGDLALVEGSTDNIDVGVTVDIDRMY